MEFLKDILGEELFAQLEEKINAHNGNEANKDKLIKIANLGNGEYVGKGKYDSLEATLNGKNTELENANNLIAELKKGTKGNEELQSKITGYESQVSQLQAELQEVKIKSAIKVALLSENALDTDYLTYKLERQLKDENKTIELDENDSIKGWNEIASSLKTQFPTQFSSAATKKYEEKKLPNTEKTEILSKKDILSKPYAERVAFANENPEAYAEAMKN